jgi:DNA-binding GntR family transcriptional regulator
MARPFASEPAPYGELVDQHEAIIEAIKASNSKLAIEELSHHINSRTYDCVSS